MPAGLECYSVRVPEPPMPTRETRHLTVRELEQELRTVDPAVLLVPPRILRRVIRLDRRLNALGYDVPHGHSYAVSRDAFFEHVSRFELELNGDRQLPENLLLLERPDPDELESRPAAEVLYDYWRRLFHLRVHRELEQRAAAGQLTDDDVLERLHRLGPALYAEIRGVLQRDDQLLPPRTDLSTYIEFAAVFLELQYFAPEQLPWHFPAAEDAARVSAVLAAGPGPRGAVRGDAAARGGPLRGLGRSGRRSGGTRRARRRRGRRSAPALAARLLAADRPGGEARNGRQRGQGGDPPQQGRAAGLAGPRGRPRRWPWRSWNVWRGGCNNRWR